MYTRKHRYKLHKSNTLTSTDTLEVTEVVKDEYMEISKEQKEVVEK